MITQAWTTLALDLDGGSAMRSNRPQFIKHIAQFCQPSDLRVQLIYYPLSHSRYNPIERCWAALENYRNGTILNTIEDALQWATQMTWHGFEPLVHMVDGIYPKKVKISKDEIEPYKQQWQRPRQLPKWNITIVPT